MTVDELKIIQGVIDAWDKAREEWCDGEPSLIVGAFVESNDIQPLRDLVKNHVDGPMRLLLEPVGQDWDGSFKLIMEISYLPIDRERFGLPPMPDSPNLIVKRDDA